MAGFAKAQGYGEQAPVQFRFANQGFTNAVYARQLAGTGVSASSGSGSNAGNSGSSQGSSQLSNVIQVYNNQTYNVSGSNNYLNIEGTNVNGTQTSSGSNQNSSNAKANDITVTTPPVRPSQYLNP